MKRRHGSAGRWIRRRTATAILLAAWSLSSVAQSGPREQPAAGMAADPVERARSAIARDDYQTELPGVDAAEASTDAAAARFAPRWRIPVPAVGAVATGLAWVVLGALVAAAVIALGLASSNALRRRGRADPSVAPGHEPSAFADRPPDDPRSLDAMIAAGDWDAAVHRLLRRAIERIEQQSDRRVPISATAREIVTRPEALTARRHLAVLVSAVEHSRFGGMALDAGDFARARRAFDALEGRSG